MAIFTRWWLYYVRLIAYVCVRSVLSNSLSVDCQAPLSMKFPRQEYWSGWPFPTLGYLPDPGIKPMSPESPALAGGFFTTVPPGKPCLIPFFMTTWREPRVASISLDFYFIAIVFAQMSLKVMAILSSCS